MISWKWKPSRRAWLMTAFLGISAWLLASTAHGQQDAPRGGKKYALLVGVDRYGKGTMLPGLGEFPRHDVEGLATVLLESGYARDDVVVMTLKAGAEDPDLLPNAEPIRSQLDLMLKPLVPGDSVIVMFVGHGVMLEFP